MSFFNTDIPILMIIGNKDELFDSESIEQSYNLIENKDKALISLEGKTHTSDEEHGEKPKKKRKE